MEMWNWLVDWVLWLIGSYTLITLGVAAIGIVVVVIYALFIITKEGIRNWKETKNA